MNTIRELKQQEKYKNMLKRKNKEKNIYKTQNETLKIKYEGIKKLLEKKGKEIERLKKLCDKYEEEHKTTFEEWKKTINIIKEVREYILTHKLYCFEYDEEELFEIVTDKKAKDELLEILDKEKK